MAQDEKIVTTKKDLAEAFTKWQKDFEENPEEYSDGSEDTYGEDAANHLLKLLNY